MEKHFVVSGIGYPFHPFTEGNKMDYLKFREGLSQSYGPYDFSEFKKITGNNNLEILPCDIPLEGTYGFTVFTVTPEGEKTVFLQRRIWPNADTIQVKTRSEFDRIFSEAYTADYKIIPYDDPMMRLLGFIVLKNSSVTWYSIRLTDFKG
jgi:hypothetical protein